MANPALLANFYFYFIFFIFIFIFMKRYLIRKFDRLIVYIYKYKINQPVSKRT